MIDTILVEATWEKSDNGFRGGYEIIKSPTGYPQINGGFFTPNFSMDNQDIKDEVLKSCDWTKKQFKVKIITIKDDRSSLEKFF